MDKSSFIKTRILEACSNGDAAFIKAAIARYSAYIRATYKKGIDIQDDQGRGPLHLAVAAKSLDCVRILVDSGLFHVRHRARNGDTCLFEAVKQNEIEMVTLLLTKDYSLLNISNMESDFPIRYAKNHSPDILHAMVNMMADIFGNNNSSELDQRIVRADSLRVACNDHSFAMFEYLLEDRVLFDNFDSKFNAAVFMMANKRIHHMHTIIPQRPLSISVGIGLWDDLASTNCFFNGPVLKWMHNDLYSSDENAEYEQYIRIRQQIMELPRQNFFRPLHAVLWISMSLHSHIKKAEHPHRQLTDMYYRHLLLALYHVFMADANVFEDIFWQIMPKLVWYDMHAASRWLYDVVLRTMPLHMHIGMLRVLSEGHIFDWSFIISFATCIQDIHRALYFILPHSNTPEINIKDYLNWCPEYISQEEIISLYQPDNSLMSRCRAVIRQRVIECAPIPIHPRMADSKSDERLRSLPLPEKVLEYLTYYNYGNLTESELYTAEDEVCTRRSLELGNEPL